MWVQNIMQNDISQKLQIQHRYAMESTANISHYICMTTDIWTIQDGFVQGPQ